MPSFRSLSAALVTLALAASTVALAQDWKGAARAQGLVQDPDGKPIPNAKVKIFLGDDPDNGPPPVYTNKKGRWSYLGLRPGTLNLQIDADGFVPIEDRIIVFSEGRPETARHTLNPVPEEVQEANRLAEANDVLAEGNRLLAEGQLTEARDAFEEALPDVPEENQPPLLVAIANTYAQQEDKDAARTYLDRALAIDPEHLDALRLMVAILASEGKHDEAQEYMARLPEGTELDPNAQLNLGILRYNDGDLDAAREIFEELRTSHPEIADAHYFCGLINLNQEKNAEALADFRALMEKFPDYERGDEVRQFIEYLASVVE